MNIFPIKLAAYDTVYYTSSPHEFRSLFKDTKPKELTWYAYDVIIHSANEVEFVIFDMADSCYGGKGKKIHSYKIKCDPIWTKQPIENKLYSIAKQRRADELARNELAIIESYYEEEKQKYLEIAE